MSSTYFRFTLVVLWNKHVTEGAPRYVHLVRSQTGLTRWANGNYSEGLLEKVKRLAGVESVPPAETAGMHWAPDHLVP